MGGTTQVGWITNNKFDAANGICCDTELMVSATPCTASLTTTTGEANQSVPDHGKWNGHIWWGWIDWPLTLIKHKILDPPTTWWYRRFHVKRMLTTMDLVVLNTRFPGMSVPKVPWHGKYHKMVYSITRTSRAMFKPTTRQGRAEPLSTTDDNDPSQMAFLWSVIVNSF